MKRSLIPLLTLAATAALAQPAPETPLYVELPQVEVEAPMPPDGLLQNLTGPLVLEGGAEGVGSIQLAGGERPELLLFAGTVILWVDLDSEESGVLEPAPPEPVDALAAVDFLGTGRQDLVAATAAGLQVLDLDQDPWSWTGPFATPAPLRSLAAADVHGGPAEELVASFNGRAWFLRPRQDPRQWRSLPPPPELLDSVSGVDVGIGGDPLVPEESVRLVAGNAGTRFYLFVPDDGAGEPVWTGPVERRFLVQSAAPLDLRFPEEPPLGGFLLARPPAPSALGLVDVAVEAGLEGAQDPGGDGHCPGAVFADLTGDQVPDVYYVRGANSSAGPENRLYAGDGSGRFLEVLDAAGAADPGNGSGAVALDYDNDGDRDLYVLNFDGDNVLYRNDGGSFQDVTATTDPSPLDPPGDRQEGLAHGVSMSGCEPGEPLPCPLDDSLAAAVADFDRDGWVDVFVGNHLCCEFPEGERDVLYRNQGDGTFADITISSKLGSESPADGQPSTQAALAADLDGDLWPDLYVTMKGNGPTRDRLFLNQGDADGDGSWDGRFKEWFADQPPPLGDVTGAAMGIDAGDYDGDGDLDLFLTDIGEMDLYRNRLAEDGVFSLDLVVVNPLASPYFSWGATWADLDNDADLDLHVATAAGVMDWLHENLGGGQFTDVALAAGVGQAWDARASLAADMDANGLLDLLVVNRGEVPVALFQNRTQAAGHWLQLRLEGDPDLPGDLRSTRSGVGARVEVTAGGVTQVRDLRASDSSCAASAEALVAFGLGEADMAEEVVIHWPSGRVTELGPVAADQRLEVVEE